VSPPSQADKATAFAELHRGEPFVIPNPWDAGTARLLQDLGAAALATTSSGFAFTLGRRDGSVTLDELSDHVRRLCDVTDIPVSVDLENGFGHSPEEVARAIEAAAAAGAVGGSIEDFNPETGELYEAGAAAERIAAAHEAAEATEAGFVLTARSEGGLRGELVLDDTIARLRSFEDAGADVIYAPGLREMADLRTVREATTRPINAIARSHSVMAELVEAGAQRISVGGGLTWASVDAAAGVAEAMLERGDFSGLSKPSRLSGWA
jgi:2-methylisocitrate lyase-like PEP mutase family enzyme